MPAVPPVKFFAFHNTKEGVATCASEMRQKSLVETQQAASLPAFVFDSVSIGWMKASRPERSIQRSILNRLCDVFWCEGGYAIEVGDRSCYFQDAVVRAGGKPLLGHRSL